MLNTLHFNNIGIRGPTPRDYTPNSSFNSYLKPHKRNYLTMLYDSNQSLLSKRIDNYNLFINAQKNNFLFNSIKNNDKNESSLIIMNFNDFNDVNKAKKNFNIEKCQEYDEKKEKKFVENYYKIKNAELNKLRFGIE